MKLTISNTLIIISLIFTIAFLKNDSLWIYSMNHFFLIKKDYLNIFFQFLLYSFFHGWFFHLIFNSIFLYIFWNQLEFNIWKKWFTIFFIFITIFTWISLLILTPFWTNTIWISWFWLAILSFFTLLLYEKNDQEYKWWITAIIVNVAIWLSSQISFVWHLFWAIWWVIFYFIYKFFRR